MGTSPIVSQYREKHSNESYQPTAEEAKVVEYVKAQVKTSDRFKRNIERDVYLSLAFYLGKPGVRWDDGRRRLTEAALEEWEERPNTNIIRAAIDTLTARSTENQPIPEVSPATADEDDQATARLSTQYLDWRWRELDMGLKDVEFTQLQYLTGIGIIKTWWDPDAGDEHDVADGSPQAVQHSEQHHQWELMGGAESGVPEPGRPKQNEGTDAAEVLNVIEWGWDPGCKDPSLSDCRWAFHRPSVHIDVLAEKYPEKAQFLSPTTGTMRDSFAATLFRELRGDTSNNDSLGERCEVIEYFERPSPRYPKGLYVVLSGNVTLRYDEELPYGELPFVVARHKPIPGRLVGAGAVTDLMDAQRALNQYDREYRENLNLTGNTQWFAVEGSLASPLTKQPGAVNEIEDGKPFPQARNAPPPNPGFENIQRTAEDRIWNLAGVSDLARGKIPSGLSGRAVGMATDLEATMMGPTIREKGRAYRVIAHRLLKYARDYMTVPRMVRIAGKGMMPEVFEFKSSDVTSCDVEIDMASLAVRHPSYKREQLLMMFERSVFGDPGDPVNQRRIRKLLEFGDVSQLYGDNSRARQYAREVNMRLKHGEYVHPRPWGSIDDMEVQREERYTFMLTAEYRHLDQGAQYNFERNLAWMDFYLGQISQGVPWWHFLQEHQQGDFPISEQPPEPAPQQPTQLPQPAPIDAFGMAPEDMLAAQQQMAAQQQAPGIDQLAQILAMGAQQGGPSVVGSGLGGSDNFLPESNNGIRGPGVGDYDSMG